MIIDAATERLISILRETPGRVITYRDLIDRMWPEAWDYPEDNARQHLREVVYRARTAVEDETGVVPIATVQGRGYVWIGSNDLVVERSKRGRC